MKSTVVYYNSWYTGLASSEQARRLTDWRKERRGEMGELKDHQQQRWGGAAISFMSDADGTHVLIFESSQLEGSYSRGPTI